MGKILFTVAPEVFVIIVAWCNTSVLTAVITTVVCSVISYNAYRSV